MQEGTDEMEKGLEAFCAPCFSKQSNADLSVYHQSKKEHLFFLNWLLQCHNLRILLTLSILWLVPLFPGQVNPAHKDVMNLLITFIIK